MPEPAFPSVLRQAPAQARSRRVVVLVAGILALSAADLVVTVAHLRTLGMEEANPLAAFVIRWTGSATCLALYKLGTVGVAAALLLRLRRTMQAEIGCWLGLLILAGMSLQWRVYADLLDTIGAPPPEAVGSPMWLTLAE